MSPFKIKSIQKKGDRLLFPRRLWEGGNYRDRIAPCGVTISGGISD
jgi:hypothetical protein